MSGPLSRIELSSGASIVAPGTQAEVWAKLFRPEGPPSLGFVTLALVSSEQSPEGGRFAVIETARVIAIWDLT